MAIVDTITSMYDNVGEVYDTITNVTLPEHKNIENIPSTIRDSYLEIMNNGIDVIWDNWEKVVGEGTELTLSNTEQAPMKVLLKGNTYQDSTTGKNLLNLVGTYTEHGVTSTGTNDGKLVCSGTCDATYFTISNRNIAQTLPAGTYTFSIDKALSFGVVLRCIYASSTPQANKKITAGNTSVTFTIDEPVAYLRVYAEGNISSGTNINATFYPMLESGNTATSFEPYTNGASPNPDYPQEVHTVSGDNEVEVCGKNLNNGVSAHKVVNGTTGVISTITGENEYAYLGMEDKVKVQPNTTYTIKFYDVSVNLSLLLATYDINNNFIERVGVSSRSGVTTFTTANNVHYVYCYLYDGYKRLSNNGTNIQLEIGSEATSYEPYSGTTYPINLPEGMFLGSIGDYQDRFFKTSGKNLFDTDNANVVNLYINTSGEILTASNGKSIYIECEPSTTYTVSRIAGTRFRITDTSVLPANGVTGSQFVGTDTASKLVITTNLNSKYLVVNYYTGNSDTLNEETIRNSIMIQKGNIETPQYEPYGTNEWYLEKKIGKVVFTGANDESWTIYTRTDSGGNTYGYYTTLSPRPLQETHLTDFALSNNFIQQRRDAVTIVDNQGIYLGDGATTFIKISQSLVSGGTLENFKTWLSTHNTNIYYVLETPTYTKIEGTLASQLEEVYRAKSEEGQTNISQTNDDLPFVLSVSALSK